MNTSRSVSRNPFLFSLAPQFVFLVSIVVKSHPSPILQFYMSFCSNLDDIIWKPPLEASKPKMFKSKSKKH